MTAPSLKCGRDYQWIAPRAQSYLHVFMKGEHRSICKMHDIDAGYDFGGFVGQPLCSTCRHELRAAQEAEAAKQGKLPL